MRLLITTIIIIFTINLSNAQDSSANTLKLHFEVTKYYKGDIFFALYNSEDNHMDDVPFRSAEVKVKKGKAEVILESLESGYYSFSYFHDVNSNGELDTNFVGVPKEPYGFSNGKKGKLGPPDFEDCKIRIEQNVNLEINIK